MEGIVRTSFGERAPFWRVVGALCTAVLYAVSVNGAAYEATSPVEMPHHILLRKIYALAAFSLLGFLLVRADIPRARSVFAGALAIGLYSYAIELGQIVIDHSAETFGQHGFDVASGIAGGALGAWVAWMLGARLKGPRRVEAGAIVLVWVALAWLYTLTYGPLDH